MHSHRTKPMSILRPYAGAHLIAAAAIAFGGCHDTSAPPAQSTPVSTRTVEVVEVRSKPENESVQLIGRIEAGRDVTLYFEVPGVVSEMFVEEGDDVEPGKPIARLVVDDYAMALSRSKAEYDAAKAEWDLMKCGTREEAS